MGTKIIAGLGNLAKSWRRISSSTITQAIEVLALLGFMTAILLLHIFILPERINMALLFALPLLLSAYLFRPRIAGLFTVVALAEVVFHSWLEATPPLNWATDSATLVLLAVLGVWTAEQSRVRARLAKENADHALDEMRDAARMRVLSEAGRLFGSSLDLETVLQTVVQETVGVLGDLGMLFLLDDDGSVLNLPVVYTRDEALCKRLTEVNQGKPLPVGTGVAGTVALTGKPMLIPDLRQSHLAPEVRFLLDALGIVSYIAVPLRVRAQVIGVLSVGTTSDARCFDAEDLHLTEELAALAAASVQNARLFAVQEKLVVELNESKRQREQFFSMVIHEIAGVVTILSGYAQLLSYPKDLKPDLYERARALIPPQTKRLVRLVNDLRDLSRIERGNFTIERRPCDLVALSRRVAEEQQTSAPGHHLVVDSEIESLVGNWDCERLSQVLGNLVGNATNYSPKGGEVKVTVRCRDGLAQVSVRDQGLGIASSDLPLLFKPYSRLERTAEVKGTGLGLYVSKAIVQAHGGSIAVESTLDVGSTFTVSLPIGDGRH